MENYTKGEWKVNDKSTLIYSDRGEEHQWQRGNVCSVYGDEKEEREANAKRIIQCVNSHDDLVEALKKITEPEGVYSTDRLTHANNTIEAMINIAKEALKKAEQ